jgi:flagellar basal body-associated protein FliL
MSSNVRLVLILVAINALPAAMLLLKAARIAADERARAVEVGKRGLPGPIVPLEPFMVPLTPVWDDEDNHSVQIELELELNGEQDRSAVEGGLSRVRDTIISYLADRTQDELRGPGRLGHVKTALVAKMNQTLKADHVAGIFVKNLLVN